jgi:hypothetical protein
MEFKTKTSQVVEWSRRLKDNYVYGPGRSSLPTLIAWLSLAMIAAGWSQSFRSPSLTMLLRFGTFGIVAALGLDIRRRVRLLQRMRRGDQNQQLRLAQQQLTKRLTELVTDGAKTVEIRAALQQIAETHHKGEVRRNEGRDSLRIPVQIPVQLRPASVRDEGTNQQSAVMCEISSWGVCLLHQRQIDDRKVIVSFELLDGQSMCLTAEFQWSQRQVDGTYASGGRVVDVGGHAPCTPREPQQVNEQLELAVTSEP